MAIQPSITLSRGFHVWQLGDIYTGPNGTGTICPNVNDLVWNWEGKPLRCTNLDINTGLSTLVEWAPPVENNEVDNADILLANGGVDPTGFYLLHVDTTVTPHRLVADSKLRLYARNAGYIKYLRGANEVLSQSYDGAGNFIGDQVELVSTEATEGEGVIFTPAMAFTQAHIDQGEEILAVVYNEEGGVVSRTKLLAVHSNLNLTATVNQRFVTDVFLLSPWLQDGGEVINAPINLTVDSLALRGRVVYNNGEVVEYPVDGSRFSLYGLDDYIASKPDYDKTVVLAYRLGSNETSTQLSESSSNTLTKRYALHTLPAKHEYNIKLYAYPTWTGSAWSIRYFMSNLARDTIVEVTDNVTYGTGAVSSFNPLLYGVEQTLTASIKLDDVNENFVPYRHVDVFRITLQGPPRDDLSTPWVIRYLDDSSQLYGDGVAANVYLASATSIAIDLSSGTTSEDDWLAKVYRTTAPLYTLNAESGAPKPTHFDVIVNDISVRYPIDLWEEQLVIEGSVISGQSIMVIWILETAHQDLNLGISAFPVKIQ